LCCRRLAYSIHRGGAAQTSGMSHIPEKLTVPKDHFRHYSISNPDIANGMEFD
jgi:hypothetical protein